MLSPVPLILAAGALALAGCGHKSHRPVKTDAVLYSIGASTDPYGKPSPRGFGVVTGLAQGSLVKEEVRRRGLGGSNGAEWLTKGLILVPAAAPPLRPPLIFRYDRHLASDGTAPIPGGAGYAWFPRRNMFAYEPSVPCATRQRTLFECSRASGELYLTGLDTAGRWKLADGHLLGWTADGRVAFFKSYRRTTPQARDVGERPDEPIVPGWKGELPVWSHDHRFAAARTNTGVVVIRADGHIAQAIPSNLVISMITWAPVGQRLAFTTSGFPDPHQLVIVDKPTARPRKLFVADSWHFDWITWSPDGTQILLDDENRGRWLLFQSDRSGRRRTLPRLGGRPLWCCPVNAYSGGGAIRNY